MHFLRNTRGSSFVEYGTLVGLLGALSVGAIVILGQTNEETLSTAATDLGKGIDGTYNSGKDGSSGNVTPTPEPDDDNTDALKLTYNASNAQVTLPLSGTVNVTIDWGGPTLSCPTEATAAAELTCDYTTAGTYTVAIDGTLSHLGNWTSAATPNAGNLVSVDSWGNTGLESLNFAFVGTTNLTSVPADLPATVKSTEGTFKGSTFNGTGVKTWDVSNVNAMNYMFSNNPNFNQDISGWNTGKVYNMQGMFANATQFNQPIGSWDVGWVIDTQVMFENAVNFNQDLTNWDTGDLTSAMGMFRGATKFNGDISLWDVSKVTNMSEMFKSATAFNNNISNWNTLVLNYADSMFLGASSFNQNIGGWDVSQVQGMWGMFQGASSFNKDIGGWNTSSAGYMDNMFRDASSFNQDLSGWCVSSISSQPGGFDQNAVAWADNTHRPVWGSCP